MTKTSLNIAQGLPIPLEAVTSTFGLLGIRGSGKTHTSSVLIEEMHAARLRIALPAARDVRA